MEKDFSHGEKPVLTQPAASIPRQPFIADKNATTFAVAIDTKGKLGWKNKKAQLSGVIVNECLNSGW